MSEQLRIYSPLPVMVRLVETCPSCRGYNLESQWCDVCKRTGVIVKDMPTAWNRRAGETG